MSYNYTYIDLYKPNQGLLQDLCIEYPTKISTIFNNHALSFHEKKIDYLITNLKLFKIIYKIPILLLRYYNISQQKLDNT